MLEDQRSPWLGQIIPAVPSPVRAIRARLQLGQEREDGMECGAQAGPPGRGLCGCSQLTQQHGAQLGVLPQEGLQAHPLRRAALPTAPLLAQQPGREGACAEQKAASGPIHPLLTTRTSPQPGSKPRGLHTFCKALLPLPLGTH